MMIMVDFWVAVLRDPVEFIWPTVSAQNRPVIDIHLIYPFPRFASAHPVLYLQATHVRNDKTPRQNYQDDFFRVLNWWPHFWGVVLVSSDPECPFKIDPWLTSTYIYPFQCFSSVHPVLWLKVISWNEQDGLFFEWWSHLMICPQVIIWF